VRATESAELEAFADIFAAAPAGFPAHARRVGGALAVRFPPAAEVVEINRIVGACSASEVDALEPLYDGGRVVVSLDPEAGLEDDLRARGYRPGYPWHKFARRAAPLAAATELDVEPARRPEDFALPIVRGFGIPEAMTPWFASLAGRPGWHCFVAYAGAEPASAGALFVSGETGWLGLGATVPELRGRGGQGAVIAGRVSRAAELGLGLVVTETGAPRDGRPGPSYRNIVRAGFEVAYERPNYVRG